MVGTHSQMAREIIVVRHGEAYNTVEPDGQRPVSDRSNPPLTPPGEAQAAAAARRTAQFAPDVVVTSPFLRAAQTAFAALTLTGQVGAAEVRMGEHFVFQPLAAFRGLDLADYRARFGDRLAVDDDLATLDRFPRFPEAESAVTVRVADLVDQWLAREDWRRAAFYGHGATVGALARLLDPRAIFEPLHCSVTHLVEDAPGCWRAITVNDVSHLPDA